MYIRKAGYLAIGKIYKEINDSKKSFKINKLDIINALDT